ncbi:hypothetical protein Hanom_Chr00s136059g01817231 [Helianthus anomalus]
MTRFLFSYFYLHNPFCGCITIQVFKKLMYVMQVYACEDSNKHSGAFVFLTGQFLASMPFLFLISISSSLLFYFLIGLRNGFSHMMYFVVNFFICLLVNEGIVLLVTTVLQDMFWSIVVLVFMHVMMMLLAGFFRI